MSDDDTLGIKEAVDLLAKEKIERTGRTDRTPEQELFVQREIESLHRTIRARVESIRRNGLPRKQVTYKN